jgi:hypothetical protein
MAAFIGEGRPRAGQLGLYSISFDKAGCRCWFPCYWHLDSDRFKNLISCPGIEQDRFELVGCEYPQSFVLVP